MNEIEVRKFALEQALSHFEGEDNPAEIARCANIFADFLLHGLVPDAVEETE